MRSILSRSFVLTMALISLAASQQTVLSQADVQLLTVTASPWRFTNCASVGAPPIAVPLLSASGYDVSGWGQGLGLFGTESPGVYPFPIQTAIPQVGGATIYFRTTFNWSGSPNDIVLMATNYIDDGCVWYLNGTEVGRVRIADSSACDTLGANPATEGAPDIVSYPTGVLRTGENVLVAELHQSGTGSSDIVFGMSLTAIFPLVATNLAPNQPTNRVVLQNRSTTLIVSAAGSPVPTYQWYLEGNPITDATNASLTITNFDAGTSVSNFFARVTNPLGTFDSRTAAVTFTADVTPPVLVGAVGSAGLNQIVVEFNEVMDATTAEDEFNYVLSEGNVQEAVLSRDGMSVVLTVPLQTPDTVYTVTVSDVADFAGNFMSAPAMVNFRSWVTDNARGLTFEAYNGTLGATTAGQIAGNAVSILTSHPSFVNGTPSECTNLAGFDSTLFYPDGPHEGYGGKISGLFIPPVSGSWRLYLRSDDASELWFNPNGPSSAGRALVARETGCCNAFTPAPSPRTSEPLNLIGGQAYYIEGLYKEGIGGDFLQVAAKLEGDPTLPSALTPLPAGWVGSGAVPALVGGTFTITQQPASVQAVAGSTATFRVGTSTGTPLYYQWMRNGADIPGAVCATYSLAAAQGDSGVRFSVRVSIAGGGTETSSEAVLTVGADTTRPTLVSFAPTNGVNILLRFSEAMDSTTSQNAANYVFNGTAVISATRTNATDVLLVTPGFQTCVTQTLSIIAVTDVAGNPLTPNPTVVTFLGPQQILSLTATWKYNDSGTDLGTTWKDPGFNDSAWPMGPAMFGYELAASPNPPVATPLNPISTNTTVYFRTHFNLPVDPSTVATLLLREVVDDGAVYYLNGVEAYLTRMAAGYTFTTLATAGGPEPTDGQHTIEGPTSISKIGLLMGDNVLAAELHSSSLTSSDSAFAAALDFTVNCSAGITLSFTSVGLNQYRLTWSDPTYVLQQAPTVTGAWANVPGAVSGIIVTVPPTGNGFLRLIKP